MSEDTCSICLQTGPDQTLTGCTHSFHSSCIRQWYERRRRSNRREGNTLRSVPCPMCRAPIQYRDIIFPRRTVPDSNLRMSYGIVQLLLANGYNVNHSTITGDSLLMFACKQKNLEMVQFLLSSGALVNHKNDCGNTALIWASFFGSLDIIKALVEHGADVNHQNNCGYTSLMWASRGGNLDIVKYLVEKGGDISLCSKGKIDALFFARLRGRKDVEKYLTSLSNNNT